MPSPHCFRSHVGIESSSHDLLGALLTSFRMSSWDASRKEVREQAAGNSSGPHGNAPKLRSAKLSPIQFPLFAKFPSFFWGKLCSFQGNNDNKLLDTECYHLISLSTYIYLTKKPYEPLSLRVVPISENLASGPRTNISTNPLYKNDIGVQPY